MYSGGAPPTKPRSANPYARPAHLLATLLLALLLISPSGGALPGQSDGCDDVDVLVDPGEPTSDEEIHVTVHGVQGGEVHVEWTLTSESGQIVNAGSTYREASDDDTYHLDPLGPFARDHTFEATATAEFSDEGQCNETPSPEVPILNAPPTASIQQDLTTVHRGQDVTFTAVDLHDADGDPVGLSWSMDGEDAAIGNPITMVLHDLETHTVGLTLDDGFDLNHVSHITKATNRMPTVSDVAVHPTQVIRNQSVELTWTMDDPDAEQGYDELEPSAILGNGNTPLPLDEPSVTTRFQDAGEPRLTARADDGHTTADATVTATVLDRVAPDLPQTTTAAQYTTLHIPTGNGVLTSESEPPFLHHTWPANDASELTTRLEWADTNEIEIVTIEGPLPPLIADLTSAVQNAYTSGTTIVVPAPPKTSGAFQTQGLAAMPEVITLAYGPDGDDILTGCGPTPELSAKPDLAVHAQTQEAALDQLRNILMGYILHGVSDPLLLRALTAGSAVAGNPFDSGAGSVQGVPEETPLIPALPLTPYLDFGVVNDEKAQGTDLGVLNLNGLNTRLHDRFDGSLPSQNVTVHVESEFHYLPDLLEHGFNALACSDLELPRHRLTTPLEQEVPPAAIDAAPLVPELAPLIEEINALYTDIDPSLRENDFDNELTLAEWDALDQAARTIRDERAGIEEADPMDAVARMDSIQNASDEICTLIAKAGICDQVELIKETAGWLIQETYDGIHAIRNATKTTTLDYRSDAALTQDAPRGLYIGYTTMTTTGTLDGEPIELQQAPMRIPTAMLVTGTAIVDVTYPDGSSVVNTTVEASTKAVTGTTPYPVDPVSNLFVTIPSGYHVSTDGEGRAVLEHLAPLMTIGEALPDDRWHFGAYYDAPLALTAESGDERLPMMLEPVTDETLFGPSMTMMALAVKRNATHQLKDFILDNQDAAQAPQSFHDGHDLLARDVTKEIPIEIPTGAYTRVVDDVDPTMWRTGTLNEGTLGDVDEALGDVIGSTEGWVWETDENTLHGVSTHGQSAGIARYTYPLPDAEHIELGLNAQLGDDTRGLPFIFATMDENMTDELDRFLEETLEYDITDPSGTQETLEAMQWFAQRNHMVRLLPLAEPTALARINDFRVGAYPNNVIGYGTNPGEAVTTEFTLEGRPTDTAALTLVVLPAPATSAENDPTGSLTHSPALGGEISLTTSLRLLTYKPLERDDDGTMTVNNPVDASEAESWDTFLTVPKDMGAEIEGIASAEAPRATPPATSGVKPGFQPFVSNWRDADQADDDDVRAYAITPDRPVYITAPREETTCWYDASFSAKHYEQVTDPRPSGICLILTVAGDIKVSFPNSMDEVSAEVELSAGTFVYHPFAIFFGETEPPGTMMTWLTDGLLPNVNVTSYQSRWDPHAIQAAGANHEFIVLDKTLLEGAGDTLEYHHTEMDHPSVPYPVAVSPWEQQEPTSRPIVDL